MNKYLIFIGFLFFSSFSYSCAPFCALVSQCNSIQVSAILLRDSQPTLNFCRVQFIGVSNRVNEACSALSEGRLAYAKDRLGIAIDLAEAASADRARCKPRGDTKLLLTHLYNFRNIIP